MPQVPDWADGSPGVVASFSRCSPLKQVKRALGSWGKTMVEWIDFGEQEAYNLSLKRIIKKDSIFF